MELEKCYYLEIVDVKAAPAAIFCTDIKYLKQWILRIDDYITITQTHNE